MRASEWNDIIIAGEIDRSVYFETDKNNNRTSWVGYTYGGHLSLHPGNTPVATYTVVEDDDQNTLILTLASTITAALAPGLYYRTAWVKPTGGDVQFILDGKLTIKAA